MDQAFIRRFDSQRDEILRKIKDHHPGYHELLQYVIEAITSDEDYVSPDPGRIHVIDDGDYQGTYLFIIASTSYQPSDYWYTMVSYGSCSGCDTISAIAADYEEDYDIVSDKQAAAYFTLALHLFQSLKELP